MRTTQSHARPPSPDGPHPRRDSFRRAGGSRLSGAALLAAALAVAAAVGVLVSTHTALVTAAVIGVGVAALGARHPRAGLLVWLAVLALVPHWLGVEAVLYLPPVTLAGLALVPALLRPAPVRVERADVLLLLVLVTVTAVCFSTGTGRTLWAAMIVQWALAYAIGRRVGPMVGVAWAGAAFAWLMVLSGGFAVVESLTDWHPFVSVTGPSSAEAAWAPVISRGGLTRSEAAFGHPIALGAALVMALPLLATSRAARWTRILGAAVLVLGTFATLSRGPLLAAALTVLLLAWSSRRLSPRARILILGGGLVVALYGVGRLSEITAGDTTNVEASNAIRSAVFSGLLADMHPFRGADNVVTSPTGDLYYRGYNTIDNAFLLLGLHFGWVAPLVLLLLLAALTWSVLRRRSTSAGIALAGQWPVLMTVALITQYASVVWFVAGLAVSWAASQRAEQAAAAQQPGPDDPRASVLPPSRPARRGSVSVEGQR